MLEASLHRGTRVTILGLKNTEANKNRVFAHQNHLHGLFLNSKIPFFFFLQQTHWAEQTQFNFYGKSTGL